MALNLEEMAEKLDNSLKSETEESLKSWLKSVRERENDMKLDIIRTKDYLVVVCEDNIQEGDSYLTKHGGVCPKHNGSRILLSHSDRKIIAYHPLNGNSVVLGNAYLLPSPPSMEEAICRMADDRYPLNNAHHLQLNTAIKTGFQEGCKMIILNMGIESIYPKAFIPEIQIPREKSTDIRNHVYDTHIEHKYATNEDGTKMLIGKYEY